MVDALLAALEATGVAAHLRTSRWTYPLVNAGHILGIALLVGSVVPLDLRLLGAWRSVPREAVERVLAPVAAAGLVLALATGVLLLSVRAGAYGALALFQGKMVLVALGTGNALAALMLRRRGRIGRTGEAALATVSLLCWLAALLAGRFIAYVM